MQGVETLVIEYLPVVIFLAIAIVLSCLFLVASALLAPRRPDPEKLSAYECGFNAFDDARTSAVMPVKYVPEVQSQPSGPDVEM